MILQIIKKYAVLFGVKIDQISVQGDHLHLLVRAPRRSQFHFFFRVVAGQIAQRFQKEGLLRGNVTDTLQSQKKGTSLWRHRPFTRVVRGFRAYKIIKNYIQLNEKEARGEIPYQKRRLKGLSSSDWEILWS